MSKYFDRLRALLSWHLPIDAQVTQIEITYIDGEGKTHKKVIKP